MNIKSETWVLKHIEAPRQQVITPTCSLCCRAFIHKNCRMGKVTMTKRKKRLEGSKGRPVRDSKTTLRRSFRYFHKLFLFEIKCCGLLTTTLLRLETKQRLSTWPKGKRTNHYALAIRSAGPTCHQPVAPEQSPELKGHMKVWPAKGINSFFPKFHLPISRFLSLVVQSWKNSVIRLSSALREASSDAWQKNLRKHQ